MALPELIYAPIEGGTIHRYEIIGGKRNFYKSIDDANDYIRSLNDGQNIKKET